jgi:hypothetical protein
MPKEWIAECDSRLVTKFSSSKATTADCLRNQMHFAPIAGISGTLVVDQGTQDANPPRRATICELYEAIPPPNGSFSIEAA